MRRFCQKAIATSLGAGSSRAGRRPPSEAASHAATSASGSAQAARPWSAALSSRDRKARHGRHPAAARAVGRMSLAIVSPNGPVLTANAALS